MDGKPGLHITIVSDGKPGHLSQSRGLAEAIARRTPAVIQESAVGDPVAMPGGATLTLAAGRTTHRPALRAAARSGGVAIALMNPGWLNRRRFDLSVIPEHDGIAASPRVEPTVGVVNAVRPSTDASPEEGLLLIGGPSKHHGWDRNAIDEQLRAILAADASVRWTATSSRRTPSDTDELLTALSTESDGRLVYTPASDTPPGWVADQLQRCGVCWVTEDSVSMVYEALTAGAAVGLLSVPRGRAKVGRVVGGVESLVERGWVTRFADWCGGGALNTERPRLAEADRVAEVVLERWPRLRG